MYDIQHCFICRPSDSTVSEDAGIELRTFATTALAVRRSKQSARSHQQSARSHPLINICKHWSPYLLQGMGACSVRTGWKDDTPLVSYSQTIHIFNLLWRQSTNVCVTWKRNVELVVYPSSISFFVCEDNANQRRRKCFRYKSSILCPPFPHTSAFLLSFS